MLDMSFLLPHARRAMLVYVSRLNIESSRPPLMPHQVALHVTYRCLYGLDAWWLFYALAIFMQLMVSPLGAVLTCWLVALVFVMLDASCLMSHA